MSDVPHGEREPLLPRQESQSRRSKSIVIIKDCLSNPLTPVLCCTFFLQFLISFAKHIIEVPAIRLFELAACHEYYRTHHHQGAVVGHGQNIDNRLCKVPAVQNELSTLTGWKFGFDALYVCLGLDSIYHIQ